MSNPLRVSWISCLVIAFMAATVEAQVPQLINYQGRIAVGSTNFNGTGQFKFSLVNSNGTTTFWSNDGSGSGGGQPAASVSLTVKLGLYSVLLGDTNVANMTLVPPTVFTNSDVRLRVWFNDGVNGFQQLSPDQRVAAVGYAMMASTVPDGSITSSKLAGGAVTAASIAAGSITSAQLAPGAALTNLQASGQAGVASSGMLLSQSPNATSLLNAGYVKVPSLEVEGTVELWRERTMMPYGNAFSPVARETNNTTIWDGTEMIVWGGKVEGADVNTGARYNPATDSWRATSATNNVPEAGSSHTAVWSGTEMIVWGGTLGNHGWRYNPTSDSWIATPTSGAPPARSGHAAVWAGNQMIIWFGSYFDTNLLQEVFLNDGWRYSNNVWSAISSTPPVGPRTGVLDIWNGTNMIVFGGWSNDIDGNQIVLSDTERYSPSGNSWTLSSTTNEASPRLGATVVWATNQFIVWGGYTNDSTGTNPIYMNNGARYYPGIGWSNMAVSTLTPRAGHVAVAPDGRMIVWGGLGANGNDSDGAIYNSVSDSWSSITGTGAPQPRFNASAVWDGTEMIVWGGTDGTNFLNTGGKYNLSGNNWKSTLATVSPFGRGMHTAVWTGTEMIIWGGTEGELFLNTGARYNPATDSWVQTTTNSAAAARANHTAVWTGTQMLVWGGTNSTGDLNTGGAYNPAGDSWTAITTTSAPTARQDHTAVWTGTEMLVWGGNNGTTNVNTGGRYNPTGNSWTAITTTGAPSPRESHTAVWTGNSMVVWGGDDTANSSTNFTPLGDGAVFSTNTSSWTALPSSQAPSARSGHAAVWDGTEMIVWSGFDGTNNLVTGGKFNPTSNTWTPIQSSGAPQVDSPLAVWTGSMMIGWGDGQGGRYDPVSDSWRGMNTTVNLDPCTQNTAVWDGNEMLLYGGFDGVSYNNDTFSYVPPVIMYIYQKP